MDIGRFHFDVPCPRCGFFNTVTLSQISLRDAVICRGCKATVNLDDSMNETKKAIRTVRKSMRAIQDSLRSLGGITLHL